MQEFILTTAGSESAASETSTCVWDVHPPSITHPATTLHCASHGPAYPWSTPRGCSLKAATLCHVCLRDIVKVTHRFSWTFLCTRCTQIESNLARPLGSSAMTPHTGQSGDGSSTVFGRRFPSGVSQVVIDELIVRDGVERVSTRDHLEGPNPLERLNEHARELATTMSSAVTNVDEWLLTYPASDRASAEAYLRYATNQHPWIVELIPEVSDADWLASLASPSRE